MNLAGAAGQQDWIENRLQNSDKSNMAAKMDSATAKLGRAAAKQNVAAAKENNAAARQSELAAKQNAAAAKQKKAAVGQNTADKMENTAAKQEQNEPKIPTALEQFSKAKDMMAGMYGEAEKQKSAWKMISETASSLNLGKNLKSAVAQTDAYNQSRAQLQMVNDGLQSQEELQKMVYRAAQQSSGEYVKMMGTVAKLGQVAGSAFGSSAEQVKFVELMQKSFTMAGTDSGQQQAVMDQLTGALGSGSLGVGDLDALMASAPALVQAMSDFTGKSSQELQVMAAQGGLSAQLVKDSMLTAADEIDARYQQMPTTFGGVWTQIQNYAVERFGAIMESISAFLGSDAGQMLISGIIEAIDWLAGGIEMVVGFVMGMATIISENWAVLAPIFGQIGDAIGILITWMVLWKIATIAVAVAHQIMSMSMQNNALTWILLVIAVVIVMIMKWIQSVGGLQVAWLICVDKVLTAWDAMKISAKLVANAVLNFFTYMGLGFSAIATGIQNVVGDMKAGTLMILQNMINGAIDLINKFIGLLNKIPGVSIETIDHVTFGTEAKLENEAEKQARNQALENKRAKAQADVAGRQAELDQMVAEARASSAERKAEIDRLKAEAQQDKVDIFGGIEDQFGGGGTYFGGGGGGRDFGQGIPVAGGSIDEVGKIRGDVNIADEDLQMLRDVAEMRFVQNFVTLTPTVSMSAQISERVDVDSVMVALERQLEEEFAAAAESVYA